MTRRCVAALACAAVLLITALSTGGTMFWLMFLALALAVPGAYAAVRWALATLTVRCKMEKTSVVRGEDVRLRVMLRHRCPLPVAPLTLRICSASENATYPLRCPARAFRFGDVRQTLFCAHVGCFPFGVDEIRAEDVFGFFSLKARLSGAESDELTVLPRVNLCAPLSFSPGDSDDESLTARAFEDATMPTDLRAYQPGDELKKIHWKLSMRRKELLVRVYEQPARPDAVLLVDCSPPAVPAGGDIAAVRDAICEAAASVASAALDAGAPVRMPLLAAEPDDVSVSKQEELPLVLEALARCKFDGATGFERLLQLETRRMRRTGSTAVITSRMNPVIADMILRIRRMGPKVRVLLAADGADPAIAALTRRLMRNDVEVTAVAVEPLADVSAGEVET